MGIFDDDDEEKTKKKGTTEEKKYSIKELKSMAKLLKELVKK